MDILKPHLKTSVRKLKLGCKWIFQMDNDPKHTSKVVAKWLNLLGNKVKVLEWPSQSPDFNPIKKCVGRTEKACVSKEAYQPAVRRNEPKFTQLIVGSLRKATQTFDPS